MPTLDMVQINVRVTPKQREAFDKMVEELATTGYGLMRDSLALMAEKHGFDWPDNVRQHGKFKNVLDK